MELGLRLGSEPPFGFPQKRKDPNQNDVVGGFSNPPPPVLHLGRLPPTVAAAGEDGGEWAFVGRDWWRGGSDQNLGCTKKLRLSRKLEIWFQNRRARTKLKQTEVGCEYLKKSCETLTQQNTKLLNELQDLRALKTTDSLFMHLLPPTTLTFCASCQRAAAPATSK